MNTKKGRDYALPYIAYGFGKPRISNRRELARINVGILNLVSISKSITRNSSGNILDPNKHLFSDYHINTGTVIQPANGARVAETRECTG
ncbi:MAG: hypothetical protein ABGW81_08460 [Paracoccaceae bacterium]